MGQIGDQVAWPDCESARGAIGWIGRDHGAAELERGLMTGPAHDPTPTTQPLKPTSRYSRDQVITALSRAVPRELCFS